MTNYFKLFGIEVQFEIDQKFLTKKYYDLSRANHPDKFILASAEDQSAALSRSTQINEGYKILKTTQSRYRHILELADITIEEGKETVPQEFLMEMMDINESVMEYQMDPNPEMKTKLEKDFESLKRNLRDEISEIIKNFDFEHQKTPELQKIKEYYLKSKYLSRVRNNLENNL